MQIHFLHTNHFTKDKMTVYNRRGHTTRVFFRMISHKNIVVYYII